ncbi:alpha/beta fold hydrolase [Kribbella sp. NPDC058245]|uniref:alpha/beta fold hydrolase n=1 Tax=Kribbella sp. NPDC058245 TaxID=3346399 RepID=UPI0036EDA54D
MTAATDGELRIGSRLLNYTLYGPTDGFPVVSLGGTPSTRWKRPHVVEAIAEAGLRMLIPDRPGYGGSTRQPGRSVADAAGDVAQLADHLGWDTFALTGGSGGGPHALACAALLPDRVIRCATVGGIAPPLTHDPEPTEAEEQADPRRDRHGWQAARDVNVLRPELEESFARIMAAVAAGGPEFPPDPHDPAPPAPPARDSPEAMARLTATFVTSIDGVLDDLAAFSKPWGFDLTDVRVPTSIWHGTADERAGKHAGFLIEALSSAESIQYVGGHVPPSAAYREILRWLRGATN